MNSAEIAKERLIGAPITFAAYGLHFRARGPGAGRAEEWVCQHRPRALCRMHTALSRFAAPPAFSPLREEDARECARVQRAMRSLNATLEALNG
jgi:hypothetical protein